MHFIIALGILVPDIANLVVVPGIVHDPMYYEYLSLQCTAVAEVCEGQNHINYCATRMNRKIILYVDQL